MLSYKQIKNGATINWTLAEEAEKNPSWISTIVNTGLCSFSKVIKVNVENIYKLNILE